MNKKAETRKTVPDQDGIDAAAEMAARAAEDRLLAGQQAAADCLDSFADAVAESHRHPEVEAVPSRCLKCGSTDRERYFRTTAQAFAGVDKAGNPFTHIIRRWTRCKKCRQARVDRSRENRIGEANEEGNADETDEPQRGRVEGAPESGEVGSPEPGRPDSGSPNAGSQEK